MAGLLKKPQYVPYDALDQCISILAGSKGFLDDLALSSVHEFERDLLDYYRGPKKDLRRKLVETGSFKEIDNEFKAAMKEFKASWSASA